MKRETLLRKLDDSINALVILDYAKGVKNVLDDATARKLLTSREQSKVSEMVSLWENGTKVPFLVDMVKHHIATQIALSRGAKLEDFDRKTLINELVFS